MQAPMGRGGYNCPNERSISSTTMPLYLQGRGGYNDVNDGDSDDS